jgi:Cyclic-phosphate processing Receiver domain
VKTPQQTIDLLQDGGVSEVSLDHDLGLPDETGREQTGYDVLVWLEEQVAVHGFQSPKLTVHSANPPAHERMQRAIEAIQGRNRGER